MSKLKIRTAYDPSEDAGISFEGEKSLTVQSEKDNCDINVLMARYEKSGVLPVMNRPPVYADVFDIPSFQESLETVIAAQNAFDSLDAKVRDRFNNDPAKLIEFLAEEDNYHEALKLGLVEARQEAVIETKTAAEAA